MLKMIEKSKKTLILKLFSSSILGKIILIFSLPIIANFLGPVQYANVGILNATIAFILILITFRVDDYLMKSYYKMGLNDFKITLFNCFIFSLILAILIALISITAISFFNLDIYLYSDYWFIILLISLLTVFYRFYNVLLRVLKKDNLFVLNDFLEPFLKGSLALLLVVFVVKDWKGYLHSQLVVYSLLCLLLLNFFRKNELLVFKIELKKIKSIFFYCLSLVSVTFIPFVKFSADKLILAFYEDLSIVGQYSLAFSVIAIFNLLNKVFFSFYQPLLYERVSKVNSNTIEVNLKELAIYSFIYSFFAFTIFIGFNICIEFFFNSDYQYATVYIPYLIFDAVLFFVFRFLNLYNLYLDNNYTYRKILLLIVIFEVLLMLIITNSFGVFGMMKTVIFFSLIKIIFTLWYKNNSNKFNFKF